MSTKKQKQIAIFQMLVCATLWSMAGILIKKINCSSFVIAGARSTIAFLTVFTFMKINKNKIIINKKVMLCSIFLSSTLFSFVIANKLTTAANAIVLQYTLPVFILLFSLVFLKKKIIVSDVLVVIATIVGITLLVIGSLNAGSFAGNAIAVLSGALMAGVFLLSGESSKDERISGILFGHLLTSIIGIPFLFFTENSFDTVSVISLLILGVVQLGIPYVLLMLALEHCPPFACSILSAIEPLLNPVWVVLFDGESPTAISIFGGIIVIVSITIWSIWTNRRDEVTSS